MPDYRRPGTTAEQIRDDRLEPSEWPPPPIDGRRGDGNPSSTPPPSDSKLDRFSKRWGSIVALAVGAVALIDIGVRIAARNDSYATRVELERVNQRLDGIVAKLDEIKVSDIKPLATAANDNALGVKTALARTDKTVRMIQRSIEGYNAIAVRRGQITPFPLQEEP